MAFKVISQRRYNETHLQYVHGVTDAARYADAYDELTDYIENTCHSYLTNIDNITMVRLRDLQDGKAYGDCAGYQCTVFFTLPNTSI